MDYKIKSALTVAVILVIMITVGVLVNKFQGGITGGVIGNVVACGSDSECNDGVICTIDSCKYAGTENSFCDNRIIDFCKGDDNCCPPGCSTENDNDC